MHVTCIVFVGYRQFNDVHCPVTSLARGHHSSLTDIIFLVHKIFHNVAFLFL